MTRLLVRRNLDQRGVTAIEFAFVAPVFLLLIFGTIDAGRLMWYQVSMQRAAAVSARCGALATPGCTTDLAIRDKALSAAVGTKLVAANVSVSRTSCGVQVKTTRQFAYSLPIPGVAPIALTAQACHPIIR